MSDWVFDEERIGGIVLVSTDKGPFLMAWVGGYYDGEIQAIYESHKRKTLPASWIVA